jgi:putative transposase
VNRSKALSIVLQCELLDLPRSTFYHVPLPVNDDELKLMRLIDECHLKLPFYGARRIRGEV